MKQELLFFFNRNLLPIELNEKLPNELYIFEFNNIVFEIDNSEKYDDVSIGKIKIPQQTTIRDLINKFDYFYELG